MSEKSVEKKLKLNNSSQIFSTENNYIFQTATYNYHKIQSTLPETDQIFGPILSPKRNT